MIKQPNVSGQFYPADPKELSRQIDQFISEAKIIPFKKHIDILIAPHAGYPYSGKVAAYGFKAVSQNQYSTIIILAPSHFYGFDGISIWDDGGFETPLGIVKVDQELSQKFKALNTKIYFEPLAFAQEHSLEVELPFLQKIFHDFKIVPIVMGQPGFKTLEDFAETLDHVIGDRKDILILVSTDMSHYHEDAVARQMDARSVDAIKTLDAQKIFEECPLRTTMEMCGSVPVVAALLYAKKRKLNHIDILNQANSGDATGDRSSVVGYMSAILYEDSGSATSGKTAKRSTLTLNQKRRLMDIAKKTIETYVNDQKVYPVQDNDSRLLQEEGVFVTIRKQGQLRGCIGNIIGRGPMNILVRDMAISAATQDPRFKPLSQDELSEIDLEISVLSKPREIKNIDEIDLGVHGVIVGQGAFHQGVFLPEVATDTGWSKEQFLTELCTQKAGLPPDCWKDPRTKIEIFTTESFSEKDVQ